MLYWVPITMPMNQGDIIVTAPANPLSAEYFVYKPWKPKGFIQFEIIINVLVSSF